MRVWGPFSCGRNGPRSCNLKCFALNRPREGARSPYITRPTIKSVTDEIRPTKQKYTDSGGKLPSLWVWPTDGWSTGSTGPIFPPPFPLSSIANSQNISNTEGQPTEDRCGTKDEGSTLFHLFPLLPFCAGTLRRTQWPLLVLQIVADPMIHSATNNNVLERSKMIQAAYGKKIVKNSTKNEKPVPLFLAAGRLRLMENIRQN